jgi:hypothetical protein
MQREMLHFARTGKPDRKSTRVGKEKYVLKMFAITLLGQVVCPSSIYWGGSMG